MFELYFYSFVLLLSANFVLVFFKAVQQRNVVGDYYLWVVPTSFAMAYSEVAIILNIVEIQSYWAGLPMGLGGGTGALLGMYLHRKFISNGDDL